MDSINSTVAPSKGSHNGAKSSAPIPPGQRAAHQAQAEFLPHPAILWLMHCFSEKQAVIPTQLPPGRMPHSHECGIPTITRSTPQKSKILFPVLKLDTALSPVFAQTSYLK